MPQFFVAESCELGKVFSRETKECYDCTGLIRPPSEPTDRTSPFVLPQITRSYEHPCYDNSYCIKDIFTGERRCTCEYPLTLARNANNSCGFCDKDSDCFEKESCISLPYHGKICGFPCRTNFDCVQLGIGVNLVCKTPLSSRSARGPSPSICGCDEDYNFLKGFGCRLKQNISEDAIECYQCKGEGCLKPPYEKRVSCKKDELCYVKTTIPQWAPRR